MAEQDKLRGIINEIDSLIESRVQWKTPEMQAWYNKTVRWLINRFGTDSYEYKSFCDINFQSIFLDESHEITACAEALKRAKAILLNYLNEFEEEKSVISKSSISTESITHEHRITDVTRQDILDIIRDGIWIPYEEPRLDWESGKNVDGYYITIPVTGRLSEIDFLSRLYDLDKMPSTDSRFSNASGDIWQHTVNNDDWDAFWYFSDRRFHLSNGNDDRYLLKFICEMLHPAVRDEKSNWKKYLEKFNEILEPDGYQLIPIKKISGRDVFEASTIDHIAVSHSSNIVYANMKPLGDGSYATVFRYTDEFYQKDFALKRAKSDLDAKEKERFRREYDQMRVLHSPYIVEVYSFNEERNEYTMELMDYTLEKYISLNNATMEVASRKSIIYQLLRAYNYLHSKGVFHRDISPKNVLLKQYDDTLVVKLSDFGLVKIPDSDLTSLDTQIKGSLNDPALKVEGFSNYGLLHELYAITLLFVFVMTGKTNWSRVSDLMIKTFMEKGTNPDKKKRFQTLDELGEQVKKCLDNM